MLTTNNVETLESIDGSPFSGQIIQQLFKVLHNDLNSRFHYSSQVLSSVLTAWVDRKDIQLFLMNYFATKNLVRTPELNDTQWDFLFRVNVQLKAEDIEALLIATRDHSLPKIDEATDKEAYADFEFDAKIFTECLELIKNGYDIYYAASWGM